MTTLPTSPLSRRGLLAGGAALAAGASLAACSLDTSDPGPTPSTSADPTTLQLPTHTPYAGVEPDLPSGDGGVPQGFFHYPADPTVRPEYPLEGIEPVTALLQADLVMNPRETNSWWQGIEAAVGTRIDTTTVASANYREKLQTTIAGGDLPDLVQMLTVSEMPALLERTFTDLTPFVGGDAVADYPGLASLPTSAWRLAVVNAKIWGVVQPRPAGGRVVSYRGDLFAEFGITEPPELTSGEDFLALCRELTDPDRQMFAMGAMPASWMLFVALEMMGAPNVWSEEGGAFTHVYESEQMKDALQVVKTMWDERLIHPESVSNPAGNFGWWNAGTTSIYIQDFAGWPRYAREYPDWSVNVLSMPAWDGGVLHKHLGSGGYSNFVAVRKTDSEDRVRDLLRILDYVASPFGTQQYLDVNFGAEGKDYTLQGTDPIATDTAVENVPQGLLYAGAQAYTALYDPSSEELVRAQHAFLSEALPTGVANAALGLYSETAVSSGNPAALKLVNAQTDVILGRKEISEWDDVVSTWRKEAGDAQRQEFEEALQSQGR